jgi:hypothetical protein
VPIRPVVQASGLATLYLGLAGALHDECRTRHPNTDEPATEDEEIMWPRTKALSNVWKVELGPYGRGDCLVKDARDGRTRLLAPPGIPLASPEPASLLRRWRILTWSHGHPLGSPHPIDIERAMRLAPSRRAWIRRQARERERRDRAICGLPDGELRGLARMVP